MKIFYHHSDTANVGDDLNASLWQRLVPQLEELTTADWLVGIGTILDERVNRTNGRKIVMGAGLRPTKVPLRLAGDVRFAAVRGEHTARLLDLPPRTAVCDPGFLVARLYPNMVRTHAPTRVGFIPHVYSERWTQVSKTAADAGFDVISPSLDVQAFLARLLQCERVYAESLHGAIFADALRIPWARMHVCSRYYEGAGVSDFKWRDTFSILGVNTPTVNRFGLPSTGSRPWWSARSELRPLQAAFERRLVRSLWEQRHDGHFGLSPNSRLQERCEHLLHLIGQLGSVTAIERWPRARPHRAVRILAFPRHTENPYVDSLFSHMSRVGAVIEEFTFARACKGQYDVLHVQWPELHLRARSTSRLLAKHLRFAATCAIARLRGTRLVWTLHNIEPHEQESALASALFRSWFPRLCTHAIALTPHGWITAQRAFPALVRKQFAVIPHGHYRDAYGAAVSRATARDRLQLPSQAFVYLFIGSIRPYKNVPLLLTTFDALSDDNAHLVIAGKPSAGVSAAGLMARTRNERVHWHLEFIPDAQMPVYLAAADVVVLPFDSIQNSGSVLLALSFDRVVVAPRLGALPEIQRQVGTQWLTLYDGALAPGHLAVMRDAVPPETARVDLSGFEWTDIARRTLEFYAHPRRSPFEQSTVPETSAVEPLS